MGAEAKREMDVLTPSLPSPEPPSSPPALQLELHPTLFTRPAGCICILPSRAPAAAGGPRAAPTSTAHHEPGPAHRVALLSAAPGWGGRCS